MEFLSENPLFCSFYGESVFRKKGFLPNLLKLFILESEYCLHLGFQLWLKSYFDGRVYHPFDSILVILSLIGEIN